MGRQRQMETKLMTLRFIVLTFIVVAVFAVRLSAQDASVGSLPITQLTKDKWLDACFSLKDAIADADQYHRAGQGEWRP